jgi:hypothetical protein
MSGIEWRPIAESRTFEFIGKTVRVVNVTLDFPEEKFWGTLESISESKDRAGESVWAVTISGRRFNAADCRLYSAWYPASVGSITLTGDVKAMTSVRRGGGL